jgi:uncharacterized protein (TIGR02996 family)
MSETVLQLASPAARGLFRAIVEDPADDVPRLLLADVLEEAGEGERASFIRVQCELAKHEAAAATRGTDFPPPPMPEGFLLRSKREALRRRERELLEQHHGILLPYIVGGQSYSIWPWGVRFSGGAEFHFRRGFVAAVTLTCADWCGAECRHCNGSGSTRPMTMVGVSQIVTCSACHGTGRTGAHGPALVLTAPIEDVTLTDVSFPYPEPIATFMDPPAHGGLIYASEQVPRVVSRAALAWARQEAGLPALKVRSS